MIDDKDFQRIVNLINKQTVIPIIGYDLLNLSLPGPSTDLLKQVISDYCKEQNLNIVTDPSYTANQYLNSVYYQISEQNREVFNVEISNVIKKLRITSPIIFEPLKKLARIKAFKFYVNATCTNAMEVAINAYRSTAADPKSGYTVYNYRPSSADDFDIPYNRAPLSVFSNPVIYNLLGVHGSNGDYVLTEPEYIELIYDMIMDRDKKFEKLKDLLSRTSLLFLGCNFQDWFFKFFIRISANDKVDKALLQSKAVIDMLKDPYRSEFITNYRIINVSGNSAEFVDRLYSGLKKSNPELIDEEVNNNQIFISYCWNDKPIVNNIINQFQSIHLDSYWRDQEQLETGDKLDPKITKAIETSSIVLFILTGTIQEEKNKDRFFWDEWSLSMRLNKKVFIVRTEAIGEHILLPGNKLTNEEKDRIANMIRKGGDVCYVLNAEGKLPDDKLVELKNKQIESRIINNL